MSDLIKSEETTLKSIYLIRDQKVMIDSDLAELYGVSTKRLNEQVKRNSDRFPKDFMFQMTKEEWKNLKSQNATSSWGGRRNPPYMFTEQGVSMLSSVLRSPQAIQMNISIMRIFVKMREWAANYSELLAKIDELQNNEQEQNQHINNIYNMIEELVKAPSAERKQIGFRQKNKK